MSKRSPLLLLALVITASTALADELQDKYKRPAVSKAPCFLFGLENSEPQTMQLDYEYSFRNHSDKGVGDFFSSYCPDFLNLKSDSFNWETIKRDEVKVESELLAIRDGKKIVRYTYSQIENDLDPFGFILVRESSDGWCRPFLVADSDEGGSFETTIISKKNLPLAITSTLQQSGTGAFRCHILIDLTHKTPRLVTSAIGYRIRIQNFQSDAEYRKDVEDMVTRERIACGK